MKKMTLLFCLSIVGFVGYAQQENSPSLTAENSITITIENNDFTMQEIALLELNDFNWDVSFENNSHELTHHTTDVMSIENNYIEGTYTYNDYALNSDFKPVVIQILKK
jgi:hypothetical protein